ncbi:hypothetical protein AALP_AA5G078000 [Arabis alpina]|uniref:Shugoshin C-terminal domain-containing protein n=1 Tax=Arabis alpina TaxID=50452 RepID=A0A087GVL9_ARAAL|nr:hypothetical protein AALP_AA5G078000 [Arabis alpina]
MIKRSSFSYKKRQSLSDITNSQSQEELHLQDISLEPSEHVNRLMKENVALVKLLEERDKTIELSRYELRSLREGIHKLQLQNWSLAQSNTQFLAEINLSRNKVKALHHEVTCKSALLKVKCCEQEKGENTQPRRSAVTTENMLKIADEESARLSVPNRRRFIRSKSLGASTPHKTEATKRRQSRRKSAAQEVTDNLFEIEDLQLTMPNDMCRKDRSKVASHTPKKEQKTEDLKRRDAPRKHQDSKVHRG